MRYFLINIRKEEEREEREEGGGEGFDPPIHIQYERFLSGIGGGDDAIAIGYLSGNRCHVARDDMIAISASNVVG